MFLGVIVPVCKNGFSGTGRGGWGQVERFLFCASLLPGRSCSGAMRMLLTLSAQLLHFIAEIWQELPHLDLHREIHRELLFATKIIIVTTRNYWKRR